MPFRRCLSLTPICIAPPYRSFLKSCVAVAIVSFCQRQITSTGRKREEAELLLETVDVLVATPGRLLEHLRSTNRMRAKFSEVAMLVIDDLDRLLQWQLWPDLELILGRWPVPATLCAVPCVLDREGWCTHRTSCMSHLRPTGRAPLHNSAPLGEGGATGPHAHGNAARHGVGDPDVEEGGQQPP